MQEEDMLLKLSGPYFGYDKYLDTDRMGKDLIFAFTELLCKAFKCNSMRNQITKLVIPLPESLFIKKHLYDQINIQDSNGEYNIKLIKEAINICRTILETNPAKRKEIEPLKERIELLVKIKIRNEELINEFQTKLADFDEQMLKRAEREKNKTSQYAADDQLEPPNNISEMSIVPDLFDIVSDENVFLRKNITNGAYRSVDHYLDVQFRLLREDFMSPLRGGVKELRGLIEHECRIQRCTSNKLEMNEKLVAKLKKVDSLNVYFNVRMRNCVATTNGMVYAMEIGDTQTNWERSKKLMFGSLVCLSSDFFTRCCLIGTVCERDIKKLTKESILYLKFDIKSNIELGLDLSNLPNMDETYLMLETSAYFEAYKHVLKALVSFQKDGEEKFPFKENLVFCQNKIIPPPKFLQNAYIDFRYCQVLN